MNNGKEAAAKAEQSKKAEEAAAKAGKGKRYIAKFDNHKTIYVVKVKDDKTGISGEKKCDKDAVGAQEKVIKDKREQLRLAVGNGRIVTLIKGEEILKEDYSLLSEIAKKNYTKEI